MRNRGDMHRSLGALKVPNSPGRKGGSPPCPVGPRSPASPAKDSSHSLCRLVSAGLALTCFGILAGCVDTNVAQGPDPSTPHSTNIARREGVSPSGATVALASFTGGPQDLDDRFAAIFADAAKRGDISVADPDNANYLVRGYLNARPEGDATAVAYVLDIFDAKKQRAQRVENEIIVKAQAADPWSVVDDSVLAAVASKSADDLAAVMTNTPEALLAANGAPSDGHNATTEDGQTAVAATFPPAAAPPSASPPPGGLGLTAQR